jgi:TPP-dependent pyruvate/acetoin dehydrogenase alpha subunit
MIARGNSTALRRGKMKKLMLCVLAVLAGVVSTSAVAKDLKQNKQAPVASATQMTDSKDKVAASTFGGGANNNGRTLGARGGAGIDGVWW